MLKGQRFRPAADLLIVILVEKIQYSTAVILDSRKLPLFQHKLIHRQFFVFGQAVLLQISWLFLKDRLPPRMAILSAKKTRHRPVLFQQYNYKNGLLFRLDDKSEEVL